MCYTCHAAYAIYPMYSMLCILILYASYGHAPYGIYMLCTMVGTRVTVETLTGTVQLKAMLIDGGK